MRLVATVATVPASAHGRLGAMEALEPKLAAPAGNHAQIRSRERVRDLAEVYTHEREVNAMLDLVADMFPDESDPGNTDRKFFEPGCGSGNFLVEILRRKLSHVTPSRYGRGERFEHRVLRCISSTYGIDICVDNVEESRERMRALVDEHLAKHAGPNGPTPAFRGAVKAILATNVVRADMLADGAEIELIEYRPGSNCTFVREWSRPIDPNANELNLFAFVPRGDEIPVHYSELACQIEPTHRDSLSREAA